MWKNIPSGYLLVNNSNNNNVLKKCSGGHFSWKPPKVFFKVLSKGDNIKYFG